MSDTETRTPNVQNILTLRDAILAAPEHFDMRSWTKSRYPETPTRVELMEHTCGTTACIGGWASALFFPESTHPIYVAEDEVAYVLGLTDDQVRHLFYPRDDKINGRTPYDATNVEAVRVLDHLIETGKVDWNKAFETTNAE
jgi:hypothetical protein